MGRTNGKEAAGPQKYVRVTFTFEGKRYSRRGHSLAEAHAKAAELKAELKRGDKRINGDMLVGKWANIWLETYKKPSVGEGEYKTQKSIINTAIIPHIGKYRVRDVRQVNLQAVLNAHEGMSKDHLIRIRRALKNIFHRALKNSMICDNPADDLVLPATVTGTRRSLAKHERKAILSLADRHSAGLWIKTLLYCGLRPGESRALDWRHVDIKNAMVHVEQSMKAKTKEIGKPKSKAGVRDVPIPHVLLKDFAARRGDPYEPVFSQPTSCRRHTETSMRCLWKSFKRDLDIEMGAKVYRNKIIIHAAAHDLVPYCLRHTYCTDLQDAGVPINVARYLMGHASIETTSRIYTHTTQDAIAEAAAKINSALGCGDA